MLIKNNKGPLTRVITMVGTRQILEITTMLFSSQRTANHIMKNQLLIFDHRKPIFLKNIPN